jgi:hypothetical protein
MSASEREAALDGGLAKADAIAKQIEGSVTAANQAQSDRAKIRQDETLFPLIESCC